MTNRGRVLKALRGAPTNGRTVAQITERDLAGKLTPEKTETALEQLLRAGRITMYSPGRFCKALVDNRRRERGRRLEAEIKRDLDYGRG